MGSGRERRFVERLLRRQLVVLREQLLVVRKQLLVVRQLVVLRQLLLTREAGRRPGQFS
ncbi:hypothetical protein AB0L35_19850 [Streptomyces sp. NPDC052309]|uniref:hypothetical protein n=1 Tax=Streptomyces sp. NPDC052309 TaxID=3155421 RepID=UPI0034451FF0